MEPDAPRIALIHALQNRSRQRVLPSLRLGRKPIASTFSIHRLPSTALMPESLTTS